MNLGACRRLRLGPHSGAWFRAFDPMHSGTPLGFRHTRHQASRFSPGRGAVQPFDVLYFAENAMVALLEVGGLFGSVRGGGFLPNPARAWLTINVNVRLQQVADLTSVREQRQLGTSAQELTGDWEGYSLRMPYTSVPEPTGTAPTQDLGAALFEPAGLEGFFAVSAKVPYQKNLVVFPDKLLKGSLLAYQEAGGKRRRHVIRGRR